MSSFELLVHIAAQGTVKDDARWRSIARGIANFRLARRSKGVESIDSSTAIAVNSSNRCTHKLPAKHFPNDMEERSAKVPAGRPKIVKHDGVAQVTKKRSLEECEESASRKVRRTAHARSQQRSNPPFKCPLIKQYEFAETLPRSSRPRTAPEATVLVPFTASPRQRRSQSFTTFSSSGSDYAKNQDTTDRVQETSFLNYTPRTNLRAAHAKPNDDVCRRGFDTPGFPGNQEHNALLNAPDSSASDSTLILSMSQTSFDDIAVLVGTQLEEVEQASHDLNNFPQISTQSAVLSAIDCIQPSVDEFGRCLGSRPTDFNDGQVESRKGAQHITRRDVFGPVSSPIRIRKEVGDSRREEQTVSSLKDKFRTLSHRIRCARGHSNWNGQHESYVPEYLKDNANRFDLGRSFWPLEAEDDIRNSDRGFWQVHLVLSSKRSFEAQESFSSGTQWSELRFQAEQQDRIPVDSTPKLDCHLQRLIFPAKDPLIPTDWDIDSFLDFWKDLEKTIQRGRMGYDTRATIEEGKEISNDDVRLDMRVYCWGEAAPHVWHSLNALSLGKVEMMPLQWHRPKSGPVLTMSGQPRNTGTRRWVEKKGGLNGSWGLEII